MRQRMFKPKDGRPAKLISSLDEIRAYMGDSMDEFGDIEVINNNLVITYLKGLPITLGYLI